MGKHMRRALAVVLATCMVAGLNPASALAATPRNIDTGQAQASRVLQDPYGTAVSDARNYTGAQGTTADTNVNVAVTSDFTVAIDDTTAIDVDDAQQLYAGAYHIDATLSHGNPIAGDGTSYYRYRWVRQVLVREGEAAGTYVDDTAYNDASSWQEATIEPGANNTAHVRLNLADDAATLDFRNQAQYLYTIEARDGANIPRTAVPGVIVNCNAHYADQTIDSAAVAGLTVRGLIHIGDPQLNATDLLGRPGATLNALLLAADGLKVGTAVDFSITEQLAANDGHAPYLSPLTTVWLPVPDEAPDEAYVLRVVNSADGQGSAVEKLGPLPVGGTPGNRFVELTGGAAGVGALDVGVFAVAYELRASSGSGPGTGDAFPPVQVTSRVDGRTGGLIDIMGTHRFAQGTTVRYTFLPYEGFKLVKVVIDAGEGAPVELRPDDATGTLGENYLDYTTVKLATPTETPKPVTITAFYEQVPGAPGGMVDPDDPKPPVDPDDPDNPKPPIDPDDPDNPKAPVQLTASVAEGEGTVSIDGGIESGAVWTKEVTWGRAATVRFNPEPGSVLDRVEMETVSGGRVRVEVINSSLLIPTLTEQTAVYAYFRYGTPISHPLYTVSTDAGEHGSLSATSPVYYGDPSAVQALPDAGYKLASLYYTFDDDAEGRRFPLRDAASGSYLIDYVLGNITVHATFTKATISIPIVVPDGGSVDVEYTPGDGGPKDVTFPAPGGTLPDVSPDGDIIITPNPDPGKQPVINVVTKDGEEIEIKPGPDGSYVIPSEMLPDIEEIIVDFVDIVPDTLSVNVSVPEAGVIAKRADASGVLASGTYLLEDIDPENGLTLTVELLAHYKDLAVVLVDADGTEHPATPTSTVDGVRTYLFAPELLGPDKTIRITCELDEADLPVNPEEITVTAQTNMGTITPDSQTVSGDIAQKEDVTFTMSAPDADHELDYIVLSRPDGERPIVIFASNPDGGIVQVAPGVWEYTLGSDRIKIDGYTNVSAFFKEVDKAVYTVTPILVDETGALVGAEAAHGSVSPAQAFSVVGGGSALLTFIPANTDTVKYRTEYSINGAPFRVADRLSVLIMDIHADQQVRVRFVADTTAEERETYTVKVGVKGTGGSVDPAGDIQVARHGSLPVSLFPDEGHVLSYVIVDAGTDDEYIRSAASLAATNGQFILADVTADHTVHAVFAPDGAADELVKWVIKAGENGTVDPDGTIYIKVDDGGRDVVITPDDGYVISEILVNGQPVNIADDPRFAGSISGGTFTLPADMGDGVFEVIFAPREDENPPTPPAKYVTVEVTCGSGGAVSPAGMVQVIEGDSLPINMQPDTGKQVAAVELTYKNPDGTTRTEVIPWTGDTYTVPGVPGDLVEVHVRFEDASQPKPPVSTIDVTPVVAAGSVGLGIISPGATVRVTEGGSALFSFIPEEGCEVVSAKLDGTEVAGRGALRSVVTYAQLAALGAGEHRLVVEFAHTADLPEPPTDTDFEVTVSAEAEGPGSVSPTGPFLALGGTSQTFTFSYESDRAYIASLEVTTGQGDEARTEQVSVWEFAMSYTIGALAADTHVRVVFAERAGADNPSVDATEYVTMTGVVVTENRVGDTTGGTIHPSGKVRVVSGVNAQRFLFRPNPGYVIDCVTVATGTGADATVRMLSAAQVAAKNYVVAGVTADTQVTVRFVPEYYLVDVRSGDGGLLDPEGTSIKVPYGKRLELLVEPDEGYELEGFQVTGLVKHEGVCAQGVQIEGARALTGEGTPRTYDRHAFAVSGPGTIYATFKMESGTNTPTVPGQMHTINASTSGHGQISPAGQLTYAHGATAVFTLRPAVGYQPESVTLRDELGERTMRTTSKSITLTIERDGEVIANFAPTSPAGSNAATARALRTLQSLAKTGDGQAIGLLGLMSVAFGAAGLAVLVGSRRRWRSSSPASREG